MCTIAGKHTFCTTRSLSQIGELDGVHGVTVTLTLFLRFRNKMAGEGVRPDEGWAPFLASAEQSSMHTHSHRKTKILGRRYFDIGIHVNFLSFLNLDDTVLFYF